MPLENVEVSLLRPERFAEVLRSDAMSAFEHTIARGRELLGSRTIWNVNSTALGGGVAEMLRSLIGYARGAGLDARWVVIEGDEEFFALTKRLHNRLHGARATAGRSARRSASPTSAAAPPTRRAARRDAAARRRRAPARSADGRACSRACRARACR